MSPEHRQLAERRTAAINKILFGNKMMNMHNEQDGEERFGKVATLGAVSINYMIYFKNQRFKTVSNKSVNVSSTSV